MSLATIQIETKTNKDGPLVIEYLYSKKAIYLSSNRNKTLYELRNRKAPKIPKTTADIELVITNFTQTSDHERFIFFHTEVLKQKTLMIYR